MGPATLRINRAPVLTLWGAVVAHRLGFDWNEALSLGKAVAALTAQSKGRRLGIFHARDKESVQEVRRASEKKPVTVAFMGRVIPVTATSDGLRAVLKGRVVTSESAARYLEEKFGEALEPARRAMEALARAYPPAELPDKAFELYEAFRPEVPAGVRGWGAAGVLDLEKIRRMAASASRG